MAETKPLARQIFDFSTQADARIDAKRNVAGGICGLDSDGKVSSVQFAAEAQRNVAGGVCGLDSDGKIATAQLPAAALGGLNYRGTWNANTNSPAVVSATGTAGHYYKVSVAGVTTIDGENDWSVGDWIIFSGSTWQKVDNTDKVSSVNGYIGAVSLTKSDLSLGNVENTALSTWTGTTQVATLGTVLTGVWSATAIAIAKGGTGATSASDARENLGLGTMARAAVEDYLSAANNLSNLASASTARTNLGLGTMAVAAASSYLAVASNLSDLASASTARTNLGLGTIATAAASSYLAAANNLSDLTSATAARTTLGLGSAALNAAGDFAAASHTHAAADVVSGVIAVARLGTGMPTSNTYLRGDGVWATGDGAGDIVGPSSAVNLRVVVFNGTTGKLVSDGGSTVGNLLDRANHTGTQAWGTLTGTPTTISGYGITDFNSLGDARYLKLSGGAMAADASVTIAESTGGHDSELSGWGLGVQLSADHSKGTMVIFDGIDTYDGANHLLVKPTGIVFQNGSRLMMGTTDLGIGANKGISLRCSIDYELNWQAGWLTAYGQNGTTEQDIWLRSSLAFGGNAAKTVGMNRHTTSDTAGNSLTMKAGGASNGATNRHGGWLTLSGGISTGTGVSGLAFSAAPGSSSGTADNAPIEAMEVTALRTWVRRLDIRSSAASFDLQIGSDETLTGHRKLAVFLGNANRELTVSGNSDINGNFSGTSSGTNTGDNSANSLYSGIITFPGFGTSGATACVGNDSRLSDARTPVGTALTSANILVGSGSNVAASVAVSGDVTITNAGVTAIGAGKVTNSMLDGSIANAKLSNSAVTIGSTAVSLGETAATVAGLTLTSPTINGGTNAAITSLGIRSTGSAFDLTLATAEVLTAGRTLSFVLGDSARTITLAGNATISGTNSGDQTSVSGNAGTATALQTARTIAMTGDVAWSINSFDGTGNVTAVGTIAAGVVTLAKMASMATASILGRNTDNTGSPEVLSASTTKSLLSLNNVENTAVSTWAGTSNITTLGTIVTGVWHGTAVADSYVASASTWNAKQAGDATLTALSALTIAEDSLTIGTGADAFSQTAFAANTFPAKASTGGLAAKAITNFGLSLVDDADESTARTTLGLVIGTNVQAYDTELAALASVTSAADKVPYFTGSGTATVSTLTAFGRTLIDDADAAAGLLTLGAAALNSPAFTGTPTAPTAIGGTNTTQIATTAFVGSAVSLAVTGLLELKGSTNCSTNPNYPAGSVGDTYYVTVAGKIGGASGAAVDIGDTYICQTDNAGGTQSAVGASWFILEHNLVGALLSANNLSDLASASSARTNLGLGTLATQSGTFSGTSSNTNTGDVTLAGENYLTISAQVITAAAVNLSGTHVTGTLADARFPATLPALSGVNLTALNATNLASGTLSAARMPALTGDVTTVAGDVATTLANSAVSLAKMADVATASVFYRKALGTGAPEVNTLATLKTDLGLTGTNSGDQTTIVGITGTKAQFDTAVSDGNILYVGDAVTSVTGTAPVVSSGGTTPAISIPAATASVAGHMTAAAMSKLDGIATGANLYVHPNHSGVVTSTADGATAIADAALSIAKTSGLQSALDAKQPLDAALTALAAGSDFVQFTGPTTSTKVFTLPDASSTLLFSGGALGTPSGGTLTNCTFPTLNQSTTGSAATLTNGRTLALTGDVTWTSPSFNGSANVTAAATVVNLPTGVTQAGSLLVTAIAAPATPAAGKASFYVDSTSKTFAIKNDAGTVSHGIQTKAAVANSFVTAISDDGSVTVAQPAFTNVSGSVAASQMPALTGDVTTIAGAVATTIGALKVTNAMLEGSIAYSKLTLTGEVLNADLAGSIAASKLVGTDIDTVGTLVAGAIPTTLLTGTITNAQLDGSIDLTTKVTGILPIANGGTNASTEAGARTALGLGTIATAAATDYLPLVGGTATTFVDPVGATRAAITRRNYTFTGALVQSINIGLADVTTVSGDGSAYYGRFHWHTVPATSSANHTTIIAEQAQTNHYGTGTVNYLYGCSISASQQAGAGAVTHLYGAVLSAYTVAASGVTNQWGLHIASNRGAAGTTTDRRVINISALSNSGTITDTYGIYIGSQTAGTQTNLPFSIYSSDAGAKMYHAGNVGIGTTSPGTKLDMTGTLRTTGIGNALSGAGAEIAYNGSVGYFITYNRSLGATYSCHFGGDGATGIRVDTVGKVGIGIVIPTSKLHVVGDSNLGGFIVSSAGVVTAGTVPAARVTGLTNLEAIYNSMMN